MEFENLEVQIQRDYLRDVVQIWVVDRGFNERIIFSTGETGIIGVSIPNNECSSKELKPFLEMPYSFANLFIDKLTNEAKRLGISIREESEIAGKLKAKEQEIEFLKKQLESFINKATR